jgi:oxygen-independent coproporphyrinogen III oxidase
MAGIYIHIPFCRKACHYCNFHFSTNHQRIASMLQAIRKEAAIRKHYLMEEVETIYLGGGTPSLITGDEIRTTIDTLKELFTVNTGAEVTLEANPDDISGEQLEAWGQAGINRLSIGIQSFFEADLQWMNRAHSASQALACIELAQKKGFNNLTIDLIYGTPGLTDANWLSNIETALAFNIPHLSCYALTVEPKTALAKRIAHQQGADIDPELQANHFNLLIDRLNKAGFEHYEISNFALPGFRSRHNSSYWQGKPYLGLGPSAHSYNGMGRQWNIANNSLYLKSMEQGIVPFEEEILTETQKLNEYIMTALRTMEGISLKHIGENWSNQLQQEIVTESKPHFGTGKLLLVNERLVLSGAGKFFADGIAADLFR